MSKILKKDAGLEYNIFSFDKESFGTYIKRAIDSSTSEDGNFICVKKVIDLLGFKVVKINSSCHKAIINYDGKIATLQLNSKNTTNENNVIAALICADFLLKFTVGVPRKLEYDIFYLDEIRHHGFSREIFLATRLAIPEKIIEQLNTLNYNSTKYANDSKLLHRFLKLAKNQESVSKLLDLNEGLEIVYSGINTIKSKDKNKDKAEENSPINEQNEN